jgi:protein gp37
MMTEQIGAATFEWAVIGGDNIGEVRCAWVDEDHKAERAAPTDIFIEQFEEQRPKQVWTQAQLQLCPYVRDFAEIMLIRAVAEQP